MSTPPSSPAFAPPAEEAHHKAPTQTQLTRERLKEICAPFMGLFLVPKDLDFPEDKVSSMTQDELESFLLERAESIYGMREKSLGNIEGTDTPLMREVERIVLLRVVDEYWMDHIDAMHELRQGIRLRAYAQVNPVDEYKKEGFEMFEAMINGIKEEVVRRIYTVRVKKEGPPPAPERLQNRIHCRRGERRRQAGEKNSLSEPPKSPAATTPVPAENGRRTAPGR